MGNIQQTTVTVDSPKPTHSNTQHAYNNVHLQAIAARRRTKKTNIKEKKYRKEQQQKTISITIKETGIAATQGRSLVSARNGLRMDDITCSDTEHL